MTDPTPEVPTDPTPEVPDPPVEEPTEEEPPAPPVCPTPERAPYRTERQAKVVAALTQRGYAYQCVVGHWHAARRTTGDEVPAPTDPPAEGSAPETAPTEVETAATEPRGVQRRGGKR